MGDSMIQIPISNYISFNTFLGEVFIGEYEGKINRISLFSMDDLIDWNAKKEETELLYLAKNEFKEYFQGTRKYFDLPFCLYGTNFQKNVWSNLLKIPYGKCASYADIAKAIGNPKAYRAVGMANHHNPLPILIPCHRVIGKNKSLTGYAYGLEIKKKLLNLEKGFL